MITRPVAIAGVVLSVFCLAVRADEPSPDSADSLSAFVVLVDGHLAAALDSVKEAAIVPSVRSGDWEKMKGTISAVRVRCGECAAWFAEPDGSYYTAEKGLTDQNLKDRSYFPGLMAGETVAGPLVVSESTGHKSVIVAAPVRRDDRIIGAVGVSIFLDSLSRTLRDEMAIPENMIFFALDTDGRTTLNHVPERVFLDPRDQNDPSMTAATEEMLARKEGVVEYEFQGVRRKVQYTRSPLTGWICAVGVLEK